MVEPQHRNGVVQESSCTSPPVLAREALLSPEAKLPCCPARANDALCDSIASASTEDPEEEPAEEVETLVESQQPMPGPPARSTTPPVVAAPSELAEDSSRRTALAKYIAAVLESLTALGRRPQRLTVFHARVVPGISLTDYALRLASYFHCSPACLVLSIVYIDRLIKLRPEFVVSPWNVHRLLVTSLSLAAKFHDDVFFSNTHYAKVGGLRPQELTMLESQFLCLIGWKLFVVPEEYEQYCWLSTGAPCD